MQRETKERKTKIIPPIEKKRGKTDEKETEIHPLVSRLKLKY